MAPMNNTMTRPGSDPDTMFAIGIGMACVCWLFITLFRYLASPSADLLQNLLGADIYQTAERSAAACLFILFSSHVQFNLRKRKEAEQSLRQSEEKYRSILESIEEGYYETDLSGNFIFVNDSMCRIAGISQQELIGNSFGRFMDERNTRNIAAAILHIQQTGKPVNTLECDFIKPGGGQVIIEISVSLRANTASFPTGFRGITRDVTERKMLERSLHESYEHIQNARAGTILGLAKLAEYRDNDTGLHLERIREYTRVLTDEMSKKPEYRDYITSEYIEDLYHSSILHDIGKVGVSDAILLKPGKLTDAEFEVIKKHPVLGGNALQAIASQMKNKSFLVLGREVAYYHHERWDGKGYPKGLKGEEIPLSARHVALADVYDALTSQRSYKKPFTHATAREIIVAERGKSFDPDIVDAFLARESDFEAIRIRFNDQESLPVT